VIFDSPPEHAHASPTLARAGDVLGANHSVHDADHLTTPAIRNIAVEWSQGKG
jgi:hypothetical protein